jgi:hypothetical protein
MLRLRLFSLHRVRRPLDHVPIQHSEHARPRQVHGCRQHQSQTLIHCWLPACIHNLLQVREVWDVEFFGLGQVKHIGADLVCNVGLAVLVLANGDATSRRAWVPRIGLHHDLGQTAIISEGVRVHDGVSPREINTFHQGIEAGCDIRLTALVLLVLGHHCKVMIHDNVSFHLGISVEWWLSVGQGRSAGGGGEAVVEGRRGRKGWHVIYGGVTWQTQARPNWMSGLERPDEILPVEHGHAEDNSALLQHAFRKDVWLLALFLTIGDGCCWVASWAGRVVYTLLGCVVARLENTMPPDCAR